MFERPSRAAFEGQIGQAIRVPFDDDTTLTLRIAEVQDTGLRETEDGPLETYNVYFHGPLDVTIPQGTYVLDSDVLGRLLIFLVPLGPEENVMVYEAIFN
jgi:hypothetical protein